MHKLILSLDPIESSDKLASQLGCGFIRVPMHKIVQVIKLQLSWMNQCLS